MQYQLCSRSAVQRRVSSPRTLWLTAALQQAPTHRPHICAPIPCSVDTPGKYYFGSVTKSEPKRKVPAVEVRPGASAPGTWSSCWTGHVVGRRSRPTCIASTVVGTTAVHGEWQCREITAAERRLTCEFAATTAPARCCSSMMTANIGMSSRGVARVGCGGFFYCPDSRLPKARQHTSKHAPFVASVDPPLGTARPPWFCARSSR